MEFLKCFRFINSLLKFGKKSNHSIRHAIILFFVCGALFSQSLSDQLYTFDFGLTDRPVPQRTQLLANLGYNGFGFNVTTQAQRDKLQQYLQTEELKSGKLTIPVVYYAYDFNQNLEKGANPRWKIAMNAIPTTTDFWVIFKEGGATNEKLRAILRAMSAEAARLGKDVVVYPHDDDYIESAEAIIPFLEELNLNNVYVSFHLCHELRDRNRNRLREVFEATNPYLKYVSISGAQNTLNFDRVGDWTDAIRPLDDSELNLLEVVEIFEDFGYRGPVVLHTFGIEKYRTPEDHLVSSMKVWRAMTDRTKVQGSFEAENFAIKSGNLGIQDTPNTNGDKNLAFIINEDFVEYFVDVAATDSYVFDVFASSAGSGGSVEIYVNNVLAKTIQIPVNGDWHDYTKYSADVMLTEGANRLKLKFVGAPGALFNIDKIAILNSSALSNSTYNVVTDFRIYPNPSKDGIFNLNKLYAYQLFDTHGRKINQGHGKQIDISSTPKGIYILKIASNAIKIIH